MLTPGKASPNDVETPKLGVSTVFDDMRKIAL
jgi:hypothetical protein